MLQVLLPLLPPASAVCGILAPPSLSPFATLRFGTVPRSPHRLVRLDNVRSLVHVSGTSSPVKEPGIQRILRERERKKGSIIYPW